MAPNFISRARSRWDERKFLCVGLDPELQKLPGSIDVSDPKRALVSFTTAIVDATKDMAGFFKPNTAFYEAEGVEGWAALKDTMDYIHSVAPHTPIILDAKRGDIGNTNNGYVKMAFDWLNADAITVQPYQGGEALEPFLSHAEKGVLVLVKTSNKGSGEFQDAILESEPLYKKVTRAVMRWNTRGNCGIVAGTTYPKELEEIRAIAGEMPLLMPGIGAQGGDLEASVKAGKDQNGQGMIINASRSILYASSGADFADAARVKAQELHDAILKAL